MQFKLDTAFAASLTAIAALSEQFFAHLIGVPPIPASFLSFILVSRRSSSAPHGVICSPDSPGLCFTSGKSRRMHFCTCCSGMSFATPIMTFDILAPFTISGALDYLSTTASAQWLRTKRLFCLFMKHLLPMLTTAVVIRAIYAKWPALKFITTICTNNCYAPLFGSSLTFSRTIYNSGML